MQPRHRRRFTIDLTDERFNFVFDRIAVEFPEQATIREVLCEFIARGAGMDAVDAAVVFARREAFALSRAEAAAFFAGTGSRLARAQWEKVGALAAEIAELRAEAGADQVATLERAHADERARHEAEIAAEARRLGIDR